MYCLHPLSLPPPCLTQEAYVALLSSEVAEVQLDCLHRLIGTLCAAPGGLELLCRLPFAHNMLVRSIVRAHGQSMLCTDMPSMLVRGPQGAAPALSRSVHCPP